MVRGQPFLRCQSHNFGIPYDLDGELGLSVLISENPESHVLHEVVSVRVLLRSKGPLPSAERTYTVIEAATITGAAGRLDVFPHSC